MPANIVLSNTNYKNIQNLFLMIAKDKSLLANNTFIKRILTNTHFFKNNSICNINIIHYACLLRQKRYYCNIIKTYVSQSDFV